MRCLLAFERPSEAQRRFLLGTTALGAGIAAVDALGAVSAPATGAVANAAAHRVRFTLNGEPREIDIDPRCASA